MPIIEIINPSALRQARASARRQPALSATNVFVQRGTTLQAARMQGLVLVVAALRGVGAQNCEAGSFYAGNALCYHGLAGVGSGQDESNESGVVVEHFPDSIGLRVWWLWRGGAH